MDLQDAADPVTLSADVFNSPMPLTCTVSPGGLAPFLAGGGLEPVQLVEHPTETTVYSLVCLDPISPVRTTKTVVL